MPPPSRDRPRARLRQQAGSRETTATSSFTLPAAADSPLHRRWLHALEDDATVPDYAMQVARVYADFAASASERGVHVNWPMLRRCTHQRRDKISKALDWLRDNGWLEVAEAGVGKRSFYRLRGVKTSPTVGTGPTVGTSPDGGTRSSPDGGTATSPDGGTTNVKRQRTSSPARVADIVRAAYPDATDDEISTIEQTVKNNGARNAASVIASMARRGELQLPCGPDNAERPGARTRFCLGEGNDRGCPHPPPAPGWCHCRCHARPALRSVS